jgi:hypothetical protein
VRAGLAGRVTFASFGMLQIARVFFYYIHTHINDGRRTHTTYIHTSNISLHPEFNIASGMFIFTAANLRSANGKGVFGPQLVPLQLYVYERIYVWLVPTRFPYDVLRGQQFR